MTVKQYYAGVEQRRANKGAKQMSEVLKFKTNQPEEVALAYSTGKEGENERGAFYTYSIHGGRVFFATPTLNQKIQSLTPCKDERLSICLMNLNGKNQWDVKRVDPPAASGFGAPPPERPRISASAAPDDGPSTTPHANGTTNGAGNGRKPAPAALMTGQSQFILQQLIAAIEAVHAAEKYSTAMGRAVQFSSEDIRAFAISCFISADQNGGR